MYRVTKGIKFSFKSKLLRKNFNMGVYIRKKFPFTKLLADLLGLVAGEIEDILADLACKLPSFCRHFNYIKCIQKFKEAE